MRRRVSALVAVLAAAALAATACAGTREYAEPPGGLPAATETIAAPVDGGAPPPFVLRYGGIEHHVAASSWCYRNMCADGFDPDPPAIGSPDEVRVFVPLAGTELSASLTSGTWEDCTHRSLAAVVEELGDGWWRVSPAGPAGEYRLSLFAGAAPGSSGTGDMAGDVRWRTPSDGPMPEPAASLALVVDHDGEPDSYGLEFGVSGLARTPAVFSADITVTSAEGRSATIAAEPADGCAGAGAIFFDGPDDEAKDAAGLGGFPFTYDVVLTLDGVTYTATATYPDDLPGEFEVAVPLVFAPALPGPAAAG